MRPDRVTVLADAAERAEEIDTARAEEAKRRPGEIDAARAETALRRSLIRLRVGNKRRRRRTEV